MNLNLYIISAFTGAFIGWITNLIAVKMLFHPRRPIRIFKLTIQGVFPHRQHELAEKIGEIVSNELFTVDDVTKRITDLAASPDRVNSLASRIESAAYTRLVQDFPILGLALKQSHINHVIRKCIPEIRDLILEMSRSLSSQMHEELDVHTIVRDKIRDYSSEELEEVVHSIMKREFKFIELVGGVLGLIIGIAQAAVSQYTASW